MPETEGDPLAERSPVLFRLFGYYLHWYFWRRFRGVRIARAGLPDIEPGRPVIIFSNHPSWWDPAFFILMSNRLLPERLGFGPMDARALERYGLLRRMGVFGIDLDHPRGAARFLSVSLRLLSDPRAALWITAEGSFTDARTRPIRLRPGLAHLARRVEGATLLPLALEYPFWNESKPEALARFGQPLQSGGHHDVAGWTAVLETALTETMDRLAAESLARDPAAFVSLVRGAGGVGGIYDMWRRGRAVAHGQRVQLAHEEDVR